MSEKIVRMAVTLFVWSAVIRYLSPADFGIFSFALSVVFVMAAIAEGGMEALLVRELVKAEDNPAIILGSSFRVRCYLVGAVLGIVALLTWVLPIEAITHFLILVMSLRLLVIPLFSLDSFFQAKLTPRFTVIAQIAGLAVTSLMCYLGIIFHQPVMYFGWVVVMEPVVMLGVLIYFYCPQRKEVGNWSSSLVLMKALWRQSWPMIVSGLAISIYMRLDQWMIKYMLGNEALGYYSVAVRFSESFYFIGMVIVGAFFPGLIEAKKNGPKAYEEYLRWLNAVLIYLALAASVLMIVIGIPMVQWLVTDRYAPALGALSIHVWASVFVFMGLLRTRWAINEGLQHFSMWMAVIGALINVMLNLILIPRYGIAGAAMATVAAQCFAAVISNAFIPQARFFLKIQWQALNPFVLFQKY